MMERNTIITILDLNIKYRITLKQQNQVDKRVKSIIKKLKLKKKTSDYKKGKKSI